MKYAFTSSGTDWNSEIDPRFGRTEFILIYDENMDELSNFDNRTIGETAHGAGPETSKKLFELGPNILITGNGPGGNAAKVLENTKIEVFTGAGGMTIKEAFDAYKNSRLTKF